MKLKEQEKKWISILLESIINTYKIKGNICIENYKNIINFCEIPEFKFILPELFFIKHKLSLFLFSSSKSYLFLAELKTNFCLPKIISCFGFKAFWNSL